MKALSNTELEKLVEKGKDIYFIVSGAPIHIGDSLSNSQDFKNFNSQLVDYEIYEEKEIGVYKLNLLTESFLKDCLFTETPIRVTLSTKNISYFLNSLSDEDWDEISPQFGSWHGLENKLEKLAYTFNWLVLKYLDTSDKPHILIYKEDSYEL